MSSAHHLADALASLLKSRGKSYREVAAGAGITHSILSRLKEQRIESSKLRQLLAWWPEEDRVALLAAHLWDEIARAGLEPEKFWSQLETEDGRWFNSLPPKLQAALRGLGDTAKDDPPFIDLLDAMAMQRVGAASRDGDSIDAIHEVDKPRKSRKNIGAPTAIPSLPPRSKAS